jgi:hypothetical protein
MLSLLNKKEAYPAGLLLRACRRRRVVGGGEGGCEARMQYKNGLLDTLSTDPEPDATAALNNLIFDGEGPKQFLQCEFM